MKNTAKTDRTLNNGNLAMLNLLKQVDVAVKELDALGLTVVAVSFDKKRPRLRVMANGKTKRLVESGKAVSYLKANTEIGRFVESRMRVDDVDVVWREYLN